MRTLIVSDHGVYLTVNKGVFIIKKTFNENGQKVKKKILEVPPAEVDEILINAYCSLSTKAIKTAIVHGITIAFLDSRGSVWGILSPSVITETVKTRKSQYEAVISGNVSYGEEIIKAKIYNQSVHLKYWTIRGVKTDYKELLDKDEATAARIYWQNIRLLIPGFQGRDPDAGDQFNLAWNYTYAILYNRVMKYLILAGLDPYLGFVHKDKPGNESLVYDFSEMFKPFVDFVLVRAFRQGLRLKVKEGLIDQEGRKELARIVLEGFEERIKEEGDHNPKTLNQVIRAHALKLASALREKREYKGFRMKLP